MQRIVLLSILEDADPFEAIREEEICLEGILGLPINSDDSDENGNSTLQNVNKLSKLLEHIAQ